MSKSEHKSFDLASSNDANAQRLVFVSPTAAADDDDAPVLLTIPSLLFVWTLDLSCF